MSNSRTVEIYDVTLRDGTQGENISFSIHDKIRITRRLDDLGVHYIEGGWPGSNERDKGYFEKVKKLGLKNASVRGLRKHETRQEKLRGGREHTGAFAGRNPGRDDRREKLGFPGHRSPQDRA